MARKKNKNYTYENFYDDTAILYILSYFLIGVQTSIPEIKTSKTFPGCVRSFSGYPTDSDSDFSSLKYLVCVALKIRSSARPWNRLPRYSRKTFNEVVKKYMTKLGKFMKSIKIMTQDSVRERILSKREYSSKIQDEVYIPETFSVLRWSTFLPPLAQISVPNRNISDDYKTTLITNITRGNDIQFEQLGALEGKIYYFSIVIQQLIQKVVKKNIPILKDITDNILLQNSCCNEGEQNTIEYFIGKEKSIKTFNDNVKDFEELKRYVNRAGRTQQIYIPFDTKLKYPALNQDFDEETIYRGFIHYGKFNTGINLDFTMKSLIGENTSEFLSTDDISTKISKLKREGKDYTLERFQQLLSYVTKKQGVSINSPTIVHNSRNMLEQTISYLKTKEAVMVCNTDILTKLEEASVDNFEATVEKNDDRVESLLTFLKEETESYKEEVIDFMRDNEIEEDIEFMLDNIDNWNDRVNNIYMSTEDETSVAIFNFMKTQIKNIMTIFPSIILNSVDLNDASIPTHWKLIDVHVGDVKDIISSELKGLSKFFSDEAIHPILRHMRKACDDLIMLMEHTPFLANMEYKGNIMHTLINGRVIRHLAKYYYMCCLKMYVNALELKIVIDGQEETLENLLDPFVADAVDESVVQQIIKGKRRSIEKKIAQLLQIFIQIGYKTKTILDVSNKDIKTHVLKSKEKEKSKITRRLGDMSTEEREVENILKQHRIGRWNLGQTRALFEYDGEQYEKERMEIESDMLNEYRTGKMDGVTQENMEIFKLDYFQEMVEQERMGNEISDMFRLMGDDDDYAEGLDGDEMFI